jgi:hypothetical protein
VFHWESWLFNDVQFFGVSLSLDNSYLHITKGKVPLNIHVFLGLLPCLSAFGIAIANLTKTKTAIPTMNKSFLLVLAVLASSLTTPLMAVEDFSQVSGIKDACVAGSLLQANGIPNTVVVFHSLTEQGAGCLYRLNGEEYLYSIKGSAKVDPAQVSKVPLEKVSRDEVALPGLRHRSRHHRLRERPEGNLHPGKWGGAPQGRPHDRSRAAW